MPGPGDETGYQRHCGTEYERVYVIALAWIEENTEIDGELRQALARRLASAHADALYARLVDDPLA